MSTLDEIKSKIDIVDLVSEAGVKLRHAGKNYTGFCPFHDNKHTPAFVVWPESGTWRCFGQCNEGGDIFKFVMKREGLDFKDAMKKLALRAGVEIQEYQRETPEVKEAYDHLRKLLEDAVVFYRTQLFNNQTILSYLREKRGLTDATIETFGLGYAPSGYDNALKHFTQRSYSEQDLIDAGLLTNREDGKRYDKFRNRIMIPIRDENGRMAGFGARIVDPNDIPKFLNSPETPLFLKSRLLYGLDRARKPIRVANQVVIVEGYLDVIALHQAGYENVVSPMGTALTEDQLRLLKRSTKRIVLALDSDAAGQKAVLRGLALARKSLDKEKDIDFNASPDGRAEQVDSKAFDAKSFLNHAARLQADIRVLVLPEDKDPDELVQGDPKEWARLVETAQSLITFVVETIASQKDINDLKVKTEIANQALWLIEDLPDAIERDTYRQWLARRLRLDEGTFVNPSSQISNRYVKHTPRIIDQRSKVDAAPVTISSVNPIFTIEEYCLGVLLRTPEMLYKLDRRLEEFGLSPLAVEDFGYTDHQLLFGVVRQSIEQDEKDHHHFALTHLPEALEGLSKELLGRTENIDLMEDRVLEDLVNRFIDLRRTGAHSNISQLRFLQEDEQQNGGLNLKTYQEQALQFTRLLQSLDQAKRKLALKRQA